MARVLLIDDDAGTLLGYKVILRAAGYEVATAALGDDGVFIAHHDEFDVVLCDQRLPDMVGTEVVRQIHGNCPRTAIVLVTAWGTPELIIEAKRAGAVSYAAKPLIGDELVSVVHGALRLQERVTEVQSPIGHATRRWGDLIARSAYVTDDQSTVLAWCKDVAIARATLQKRCDAVGVTPKESLDFVRLVRVAIHHHGEVWDLQGWLDVVDDRTARSLLKRAGFGADFPRVPDLDTFLTHQRLILSSDLIRAIRSRLSRFLVC